MKTSDSRYLNKLPGFSSTQNMTKIVVYPGTKYSKLLTLVAASEWPKPKFYRYRYQKIKFLEHTLTQLSWRLKKFWNFSSK